MQAQQSIRCLTLHAHWAEAIFSLGKDVENRSWVTSYRGPLLIHAGSRIDKSICERLGLDREDTGRDPCGVGQRMNRKRALAESL